MKLVTGNILLPALLGIVALLLTACEFRIHATLVIEEDESGTLSLELSADEELVRLAGGPFGGELDIGEDMVPGGWTAEVVAGDGYEGIRGSTDFESFDQLEQRLAGLADAGDAEATSLETGFISAVSLAREDDTFVFRLVIPEDTESLIGEGLEQSPIPLDLGILDQVFDIRFALVLPGEIVTSNADVNTGESLIWNISLTDSGRVLEAESELPGSEERMYIVWGAVALALVVVVYIVFKLRKRRKPAGRDRSLDASDSP